MKRKDIREIISKVADVYDIDKDMDRQFFMDNLDIIELNRVPAYKMSFLSFKQMSKILDTEYEMKNILSYVNSRSFWKKDEAVPNWFIDKHYLIMLQDLNNCTSNVHHCNDYLIYLLVAGIKNKFKFDKWQLDFIANRCYDDNIRNFINDNNSELLEQQES